MIGLLLVTFQDRQTRDTRQCTHCLDETESIYLPNGNKNVYLGHCRFLPTNHPLRKKGKHFKGEADHRKKPVRRTGDYIVDMVKDLPEQVVFGKGPGGKWMRYDMCAKVESVTTKTGCTSCTKWTITFEV